MELLLLQYTQPDHTHSQNICDFSLLLKQRVLMTSQAVLLVSLRSQGLLQGAVSTVYAQK